MQSISLIHLASSARSFWPMHIAEGDSTTGFRIGGAPPVGVFPEFTNERTQYFGTFPISGYRDEEMSIFCSFNYDDPDDPNFITNHIYKALGPDVIQCVFHSPARRAKASRLKSELEAYRVKIGREAIDDPEDQSCGVRHKIGGLPFLNYEHPRVRKASAELFELGYLFLMHWSFPGAADCLVKGDWPFANYSFDLYLKMSERGVDCRAQLV